MRRPLRFGQRNQAAVPWSHRFEEYVRTIRRFAPELHWPRGITVIPYHRGHSGDVGVFRAWAFAIPPVVPRRGYLGEAFWRLQPFWTRPHPSGLPDEALLRTPKPRE